MQFNVWKLYNIKKSIKDYNEIYFQLQNCNIHDNNITLV